MDNGAPLRVGKPKSILWSARSASNCLPSVVLVLICAASLGALVSPGLARSAASDHAPEPTPADAETGAASTQESKANQDGARSGKGTPVRAPQARADESFNLGLARLKDHRYSEALEAFARAAELEPDDPEILFMVVFAANKAGQWATARRVARQALELSPESDTEEILRLLLNTSHHGLRSAGEGAAYSVGLNVGYDSNVVETGPNAEDVVSFVYTAYGSPYVLASWLMAYGWVVDEPWLYLRPSYSGLELAFTAEPAQPYGVQLHTVSLNADIQATDWLRLLAGARGTLLRRAGEIASQRDVGGSVGVGFDWSGRTTTELVAEARDVRAVGDSTSYANGRRLELTASQRIKLNGARFALSLTERWLERASLIYVVEEAAHPRCTPTCSGVARMPLSRREHAVRGRASFDLADPFTLNLEVGAEWRVYRGPTELELYDVALDEFFLAERLAQRLDDRLWAAVGTTFELTPVLDLDLEYRWLNSVSNLGTSNRTIDTTYGSANFSSHSAGVELRATW